jgi:2-oxoglutarate ferredoxin oxidoreductase subunit beta
MTAPAQEKKTVFERVPFFVQDTTAWCAGCGYGAWSRAILEETERANPASMFVVTEDSCAEVIGGMIRGDHLHALHGRSVATARAIKLAVPQALVVTVQGDGGMLNEGLNEILHAAASGQNICVILGNNGVLGDTGGQHTMGSAIGLRTPTSPQGRDPSKHGSPIPIAEFVASFPGVAFVARVSSHDPAFVYRGQRIIRKALEANMAGAGLTFIESMTTCPTGWRMTPVEAVRYQEEHILDKTPPGIIKDWNPETHPPRETPLPRLEAKEA